LVEFILPNLGDGVAQGDVLKVLVKPGDMLKADQPVLELETDKATVEVPSTVSGLVKEVRVKAGDKVKPGQAVVLVEDAAAPSGPAPPNTSKPKPEAAALPNPAPAPPSAPVPSADERPRAPVFDIAAARPQPAPVAAGLPTGAAPSAPAAPSVRRLAREIGVDITQVTGTGPGGRISQDDVKEFAKKVMSSVGGAGQAAAASGAAQPIGVRPLPDFSKFGDVERRPMTGVRRKTAEHLGHAWNTIPHVTQFDRADITELERVRKKYRGEVEKAGGNLTVTAVATKILAAAIKVFPQFNASVDAAGDAIVYKKYVNIGIAVDTEFGLLVPVIRDVDRKNLTELAIEIHTLAEKAKARKLTIDEMSGGSMSITNLGGIGGTSFTPIINWPEVAILGISRGALEPVWNGTAFEPRQMLPLSLSYDHRLIDGADAIRFLRWVAEALEQPFAVLLKG
jgi:pyruvate dehydrogenase E2 component (dihydrolipoamide acetyltransferase)